MSARYPMIKVYRSNFSAITYIQRRIDGVGFESQNVQGNGLYSLYKDSRESRPTVGGRDGSRVASAVQIAW